MARTSPRPKGPAPRRAEHVDRAGLVPRYGPFRSRPARAGKMISIVPKRRKGPRGLL